MNRVTYVVSFVVDGVNHGFFQTIEGVPSNKDFMIIIHHAVNEHIADLGLNGIAKDIDYRIYT